MSGESIGPGHLHQMLLLLVQQIMKREREKRLSLATGTSVLTYHYNFAINSEYLFFFLGDFFLCIIKASLLT